MAKTGYERAEDKQKSLVYKMFNADPDSDPNPDTIAKVKQRSQVIDAILAVIRSGGPKGVSFNNLRDSIIASELVVTMSVLNSAIKTLAKDKVIEMDDDRTETRWRMRGSR